LSRTYSSPAAAAEVHREGIAATKDVGKIGLGWEMAKFKRSLKKYGQALLLCLRAPVLISRLVCGREML
jgi:hypothetical protein